MSVTTQTTPHDQYRRRRSGGRSRPPLRRLDHHRRSARRAGCLGRRHPRRSDDPRRAPGVVFTIGALRGPRQHPYGKLFARLVAPRLGPVSEREPVALAFRAIRRPHLRPIGLIGFVSGAPLVGIVATAFALGAAFLNAAFGICLGCQIYPLASRLRRSHL